MYLPYFVSNCDIIDVKHLSLSPSTVLCFLQDVSRIEIISSFHEQELVIKAQIFISQINSVTTERTSV